MRTAFRSKWMGFTLIELMIAVAIVAVLSAVAIPAYIGYLRRSYLNEATSSISAIKSAEESYFTINGCYIETDAHPATIPVGTQGAWNVDPMPTGWGNAALAVRPDRNVRFQYQVYATNSVGCAAPTVGTAEVNTALGSCIANAVGAANSFVSNTFFPDHWYVVVARGDLDGDGNGTFDEDNNSLIISAIDDSAIIMCNEVE